MRKALEGAALYRGNVRPVAQVPHRLKLSTNRENAEWKWLSSEATFRRTRKSVLASSLPSPSLKMIVVKLEHRPAVRRVEHSWDTAPALSIRDSEKCI